MSQWTHVIGAIRYDGLQRQEGMEHHPGLFVGHDVPRGSEGPIEVDIWVNPSKAHLAAYCVTFWGDLRDYTNVDELVEYFDRISKGRFVRSGVIRIDVDCQRTLILDISTDGVDVVHIIPYTPEEESE